jgi:hypothetical protein
MIYRHRNTKHSGDITIFPGARQPYGLSLMWGEVETLLVVQKPRNAAATTAFYVRFEFFTAVTMKNCVFWDVTPCGSCTKRRFGGTYHHLDEGGARFLQEPHDVTSQKTPFFTAIYV